MRRGSLPAKAEDYAYALPQDFKIPEGVEFKFNEGDANLQAARTAAHEMGLTQDQFSRLLGLYAGTRVNEQKTFQTARDAEVGKLGPTGQARMTAINQFLAGMLGESDAKHLQGAIWTADAAKSWEKLILKIATPHGSGLTPARDAPTNGIDSKTYDAWTPAQRLNYARTRDPNKPA